MTLNEILDLFPEDQFLKADGFDDCVIGFEPNSMKLIYNIDKMVKTLMNKDKMSKNTATEYLEFNVFSAYMGENTPIYIQI
jgi:hypothetical protein